MKGHPQDSAHTTGDVLVGGGGGGRKARARLTIGRYIRSDIVFKALKELFWSFWKQGPLFFLFLRLLKCDSLMRADFEGLVLSTKSRRRGSKRVARP